MALAEKKYPPTLRLLLPAGFQLGGARRPCGGSGPDLLVLAELELWPNLVRAARRSGARVAVINGRLSEHSFAGYRRIRPLAAALLRQIDLLAAQDDDLCRAVPSPWAPARGGPRHRLDEIRRRADRPRQSGHAAAGRAGRLRRRRRRAFWPAAPRSRKRRWRWTSFGSCSRAGRTAAGAGAAASRAVRGGGPAAGRRRAWPGSGARDLDRGGPGPRARECLLVDVVGELGAWWGTAQIAFVGGSLGNRGGQNMIEPAAYGAAVSFGPNTRNFRDIVAAMLAREAAVVVADGDAIGRLRPPLPGGARLRRRLGPACPQPWCWSQLGATGSGPGNC